MDILTHLTLGACLGEAIAGRYLGKRALVWGAVLHSLPDIDVVTALWLPTPAALLAHRGITHSFITSIIIALLLATFAYRRPRNADMNWSKWFLFIWIAILLHDILDALNNYGTGWWEPFSTGRVAFNIIYVADPFLLMWPLSTCLMLLFAKNSVIRRRIWSIFGLGMAFFYVLYCGAHKKIVDQRVTELLKRQKITYSRYMSTPAPLQNWLWYIVAGTDSGYYTTYYSVFDNEEHLSLHYFPRNAYLLARAKHQATVQQLIRFSPQFYTAEMRKDTLVFNDLRFGQIIGWQNPRAAFAFYYFPEQPNDNRLAVQRGRLAGWNKQAVRSLYRRIRGE
ncbi:metal-dependent hydrolase [Mucilaginibacter sp. 14171R-50]|uniref:metal-dependent hydrolase n=1 Tax=Mucilaginibacter sp. 14171R-50 TaxID=2703789 RepID=UPI00138B2CF1|nr:metal-dependent hydrolase [Mucilaginibacter sp. 14171R-50]QHS55333.1 metal-dependent hydrolase [Mucilaginibacter sp. 14171R-50]